MMHIRIKTAAADIAAGLLSFIIGWTVVIAFDMTAAEGKFADSGIHLALAAAAAVHTAAGLTAAGYLRKKNRMLPLCGIATLIPYVYYVIIYQVK